MELGLLWSMKHAATLQVDPVIPDSTRVPEAFSPDLFDIPGYIEVTTVADNKLSGEQRMQRAAQQIVTHANTCRSKSGDNLYFMFAEKSYWEDRRFYREHHVASNFELDDQMKVQIGAWVTSPDFSSTRLRLESEAICVTIERKAYKQKAGFNFFSPLPPLAYDIEDNPLYSALRAKVEQLAGVPDDMLRVIFVADGGSRLLRRLSDRDHLGQHKSGADIINHVLRKYPEIDMVCAFSPQRGNSGHPVGEPVRWKPTAFHGARERVRSVDNLQKLCAALPRPRFEGYQARSLQKQAAFRPGRGWYLGTSMTLGKDKITMRMSARLLQEYLAGNLTREQFEKKLFSEENLFKRWLDMGYTIRNTRVESAGVDEDDDHLVLEFERDPAAAPLV